MRFDWFTAGAQALNFLILVWLLKRFLYQPILHAINEREKRIATQLQDAEKKQGEARQERDNYRNKSDELAQQGNALMIRAAAEAKAEGQRLMEEVRAEAEALRTRLQEAARSDHDRLRCEITRRTQQEVFAIVRKTLSELASASLEERMTEVFVHRLGEWKDDEKENLAGLIQESHRPAIVRSAFELSPSQRLVIQRAVKEALGAETEIQFETSPALLSGIELATNGHKVAWSIAGYLAALEESVDSVLTTKHAASQ